MIAYCHTNLKSQDSQLKSFLSWITPLCISLPQIDAFKGSQKETKNIAGGINLQLMHFLFCVVHWVIVKLPMGKKKVISHKQEHTSRKIMRIDWSNVFAEETLNSETEIVYLRWENSKGMWQNIQNEWLTMKREINTFCDLCLNIHEPEDNQLNSHISKEIFFSILHN